MRLEERAHAAKHVYGLYLVTGNRRYRDHEPGTQFEAKLDRQAVRRAIERGDIQLLREVVPEIRAGSFTFPQGWLSSHNKSNHRGAARRLSH